MLNDFEALRTSLMLAVFAITILIMNMGVLYYKLQKTKKKLESMNMKYLSEFTRIKSEQSRMASRRL